VPCPRGTSNPGFSTPSRPLCRLAVARRAANKALAIFHDDDESHGIAQPETGTQPRVAGCDHDALGRVLQLPGNANSERAVPMNMATSSLPAPHRVSIRLP
jgi:hypothetical protein